MFVINKFKSIGTTLYTHKKKSIVGGYILYLIGDYCNDWIRDGKIRTYYSKEAVKYGRMPCHGVKPRRLTVLVNKMANERKVYDKFKTNVLPLFHLAGIQVTIIHAKDSSELEAVASVLENETDAVYVVGGDGTLSNVLTGIFKNSKNGPTFPIGHFPGGNDNKGLLSLRPNIFKNDDDVRSFCESGMSVIENTTSTVFPLKCEIILPVIGENEEKKEEIKTLYAMANVNGGFNQFVEERKNKYWYWFSIKRYFAYFLHGLKNFQGEIETNVVYTKFCPGCKKCLQDNQIAKIQKKEFDKEKKNSQISWWRNLFGSAKKLGDHTMVKNISNEPLTVNEECGTLCDKCIIASGTDLIIENEIGLKGNGLRFLIGGANYNRFSAIKDGWERVSKGNNCFKSVREDFYNKDAEFKGNSLEMVFTKMPSKYSSIWVAGEKVDLTEEYNKAIVKIEATKQRFDMFLPKDIRLNLNEL
uniref:DAGKc domain-containing protein n=1 Tax=Parastrongyloides trichosuri TaxID=131310 RepID=A0A0N4ZNT9_PARTI